MSRFKMVLGYLLGFVCSLLLFALAILFAFKINIFNQDYVLKMLNDNKYYSGIYEESMKDMKDSLHSSGLDDSVLDGIYSSADVQRDIKNYVISIYSGSKAKIDTSILRERLDTNIQKYLKDKGLEVSDEKSLDNYVNGVVDLYVNSVSFYGYFDGFIAAFVGFCKYIDLFIGVTVIIFICLFSIMRFYLHRRYFGVIFLSAGLMLLYFRYFVYGGIDFKNITIISDSFSNVVRGVLSDLGNSILVIVVLFIIISIFLNIKSSMMKIKRIKRS